MITRKEFTRIYIITVILLLLAIFMPPALIKDLTLANSIYWYQINFIIVTFLTLLFLFIPLGIYYKVVSFKEWYVIVPFILLLVLSVFWLNTIYGIGAAKSFIIPLVAYGLVIFIAHMIKNKNIRYINLLFLAVVYGLIFKWQYDGKIYQLFDQGSPYQVYRNYSLFMAIAIPQIMGRPFFRKYCLVRKAVCKLKK